MGVCGGDGEPTSSAGGRGRGRGGGSMLGDMFTSSSGLLIGVSEWVASRGTWIDMMLVMGRLLRLLGPGVSSARGG